MSAAPPTRPAGVSLSAVFAIAIPMTLAHATTPLIGITDLAVIGQLGSAALIGAVALGALLFDFIGGTLNFLRMGTTGLVAQAVGAQDGTAEQAALWRALVIALALGVVILVLQAPLGWLFVVAMEPSEAVAAATLDYWQIRVWAVPFMLLNYAILGWLLGLGRATLGLLLQLLLSGVNIALSVALGLWLGWGIFGVALASVVAEVTLFAASCVILVRRVAVVGRPSLAAVFERTGLRRMLMMNGDIMIRSLLLLTSFGFFTAVSARFGDLALAANALLMNLFILSAHVLDGLATAAEQLGGKAVGARNRAAFGRTVRLTVVAGTVIGAAIGVFWLVAGPPFLAFMTAADDVRDEASRYLIWAAFAPLVGALAFVMDGLFIGATWTRTMRDMMIASTIPFVAAWWLLAPHYGNHGLWAALVLWLFLRGVTLWAFVPREMRRTFAEG